MSSPADGGMCRFTNRGLNCGPIGVFDSGIGGLTVVREIRRLMPDEDIIYVGDSARAPYGGKNDEALLGYGREIIRFLLEQNARAVVFACGTSSSTSFELLLGEFPDLPLIDTIRPAVKAVGALARKQPGLRLGFIATEATIRSGLFTRLLAEECPGLTVHARACPFFAPIVEAGLGEGHPLPRLAAETYLSDLRGKIDALVLGCTHYPLLSGEISRVLGDVMLVNPAEAAAEALKEILPPIPSGGKLTCCTSGEPGAFARMAGIILNEECEPVQISWH